MPYQIRKQFEFHAYHTLAIGCPTFKGDTGEHGHTYVGEFVYYVDYQGEQPSTLNQYEVASVEQITRKEMEGCDLNIRLASHRSGAAGWVQTPGVQPTPLSIACWLYKRWQPVLPELESVTLSDAPNLEVEYWEDEDETDEPTVATPYPTHPDHRFIGALIPTIETRIHALLGHDADSLAVMTAVIGTKADIYMALLNHRAGVGGVDRLLTKISASVGGDVADLINAYLKLQDCEAEIAQLEAERAQIAAAPTSWKTDWQTLLNAAVGTDNTGLLLATNYGLKPGDRVLIDNEVIILGPGRSTYHDRQGFCFDRCTRGVDGTIATAHSAGAIVRLIVPLESGPTGNIGEAIKHATETAGGRTDEQNDDEPITATFTVKLDDEQMAVLRSLDVATHWADIAGTVSGFEQQLQDIVAAAHVTDTALDRVIAILQTDGNVAAMTPDNLRALIVSVATAVADTRIAELTNAPIIKVNGVPIGSTASASWVTCTICGKSIPVGQRHYCEGRRCGLCGQPQTAGHTHISFTG